MQILPDVEQVTFLAVLVLQSVKWGKITLIFDNSKNKVFLILLLFGHHRQKW